MSGLIYIGNSYCMVEGFTAPQLQVITETLTYDNQEVIFELQQLKVQLWMAHRRKNGKKLQWLKWRMAELAKNIKICWFRDNAFPSGHLQLVAEHLIEAGIPFAFEDCREVPTNKLGLEWKAEPPPLRYYQKEMIDLGVYEGRGVFESAVGTGKSLIAQHLIKELDVPALIVLPAKDLSIQTFDSFSELFGKDVSMLLDSKSIQDKMLKSIRITTIQTLNAFKRAGLLAHALKDLGVICIDEVHHSGAKSFTGLLNDFGHIYHRFGFSGTFMRNDSKTLDMWGFLSTVLYRYSAAKATAEGFLTPLQVKIHELDGSKGTKYATEYKKNYCNNPDLLNKIKDIVQEAGKANQVLILVGEKDGGGTLIHEYLKESGIESIFISGNDKKAVVKQAITDFNTKKMRILIGSSIIGEGIDIRSTDHLIMAQGGKSEIAITQAVGRAVRLFEGKTIATVHDFCFLKTKYLAKHLKERLRIYKNSFSATILGDYDDA